MIFLAALVVATLVAAGRQVGAHRSRPRDAARVGMAIAMVVAGLSHWLNPTPFAQHLPPWVPLAEPLIYVTGLVEIGLGVAVSGLRQPWRRRAGWALAAYLAAVFPANVYVAVANVDVDGQPGGWYPWARLPLQALFIAWAVWSTRDERRPDQRAAHPPSPTTALTRAIPAADLQRPWQPTLHRRSARRSDILAPIPPRGIDSRGRWR